MARAEWSYQVAPAGSPSAGLDEYVVTSASGSTVGKVQTLLRRGDEHYVAVDRGNPPFTHDVRAFPWSDVEDVDHDALTLRLRISDDDVEKALELDPDKGVEDEDADAVRVTELPAALRQPSAPGETGGPADRATWFPAVALGLLGVFAFLALVIALTTAKFTWHYVFFAIPILLLAAAGIAGYRMFRKPYERA